MRLLFAGLLLAVLQVHPAGAEGIRIGPLTAYPVVSLSGTWDSNIHLAPAGEVDDFIISIVPSLRLRLPIRQLTLEASGKANLVRHASDSADDSNNWALGGSVTADFASGLRFALADNYTREYLPTLAEFAVAEYYEINQVYAKAAYESRYRLGLEIEYFNYRFAYEITDDLDRAEDIISGTVSFKLTPKVAALAEGTLSDHRYARAEYAYKDNRNAEIRGGVRWQMTGKSTGEFRLGYSWKGYDNPDLEDESFLAAVGEIKTILSRRTTLDVTLRRAATASDYVDNAYYIQTSLSAMLRRKITWKISASLELLLRDDQYMVATIEDGETHTRHDFYYGGRLGVDFQMFRWLGIGIDVLLQRRDSNFGRFDYDLGRAGLWAKAAF